MKKVLYLIISLLLLQNFVLADVGANVAKIIEVKGVVNVKKENASSEIKGFVKMNLSKGDKIKTSKDSYVKILLNRTTTLIVNENSDIELEELINSSTESKNVVKVNSGKVLNTINKKLEAQDEYTIKTPTMIAGVRGTEFLIEVNKDNDFDLKVFDGTVKINDIKNEVSEDKFIDCGKEIVISSDSISTDLKKEPQEINVEKLDEEVLKRVREIAVEKPDSVSDSLYEKVNKQLEKISNNKSNAKMYVDKERFNGAITDYVMSKKEYNLTNYEGYKQYGAENYKVNNINEILENKKNNNVFGTEKLEYIKDKILNIGLKNAEKQNILNDKFKQISEKQSKYQNKNNLSNYIDRTYLENLGIANNIDTKNIDVNKINDYRNNYYKNIEVKDNNGTFEKVITTPYGTKTIIINSDGTKTERFDRNENIVDTVTGATRNDNNVVDTVTGATKNDNNYDGNYGNSNNSSGGSLDNSSGNIDKDNSGNQNSGNHGGGNFGGNHGGNHGGNFGGGGNKNPRHR